MPPVKLQHIISFTSEDTKHKIENLISGNGMWTCSPNEQSTSIKAEFQLQKATTIDFIDIGNYNSAMLCIEVGMSTWPSSQLFSLLLPTVALMTPLDCRSGQNSKTVRMFKRENLDKDNVSKKWDRVRVICSQPFKRNAQYGLAFLKLYSQCETAKEDMPSVNPDEIREQREAWLMSTASANCSPKVMSKSLKSLESSRLDTDINSTPNRSYSPKTITTPFSRAGTLVMAHRHVPNDTDGRQEKKELECEALTFLISLNLTNEDIHNLKVSHIREEFEGRRGKLNTREKLIFKNIALDYAAKKLKNMLEEGMPSSLPLPSSSDEEAGPPSKKGKLDTGKFTFKRTLAACSSSPSTISDLEAGRRRKGSLHSPSRETGRRNNLVLMDSMVTPSPKSRKGKGKRMVPRNDDDQSKSLGWQRNLYIRPAREVSGETSSPSEVVFELGDDFDDCGISTPNSPFHYSDDVVGYRLGASPSDKLKSSGRNILKHNSTLNLVECPLCTELYSSDSIERHAATCDGEHLTPPRLTARPSPANTAVNSGDKNSIEECPVCGIFVDASELQEHADECADQKFSI